MPEDKPFELYPETSSTPKRLGRTPMEFGQRYADELCKQIMHGKSLREICGEAGMPGIDTFYKWLNQNASFAEQYARARELQQDTYADEIVHIADTEEDPHRARVRIDARKWHASKLAPKKYGDKLELSGDANSPLVTISRIELVAPKPKDGG